MVSKSCLKAVLHSGIIVESRSSEGERVIGVGTTEGEGGSGLALKTVQGQRGLVAGIHPTEQRTSPNCYRWTRSPEKDAA